MNISPADYEKLGAFYLGREYDQNTKAAADQLVIYNSRDLVTHGVVLGMTGSGKTGLCLALLEEAAIDKVPAIVIDPKGDIANFMLIFPGLSAQEFRPWINEEDAERKGMSPDDFAAAQADTWKKGLAEWGQGPERLAALRESAEVTIYTPGSGAGISVSILASLEAPPFEVVDDGEIFGDRIESTASSLLGLLGVTADPLTSREHILLSRVLDHAWRSGESLDLAKIIGYVQAPPFAKIGVVDMEEFFPEKKRSEFAMTINGLLASPGFQSWLTGEALDVKRLLHSPSGKPRVSIVSIAHLSDAERMFIVSLLLNQVTAWMRQQSGTTSLRAIVYMDEIYGYLPPTENPPSKKPMLTLLKQARAFGVGLLLATQNPVDLDYKALSNIGTWWLGRLQTERDKARVLDGLEGVAAAQGGKFDRASMDTLLASLGNRIFLMNNVHDDAPCLLQVRWCMSYLRGPLTRTQIKTLMDPLRGKTPAAAPAATAPAAKAAGGARPDLPPAVPQYFLPVTSPAASPLPVCYVPHLLVAADVLYADKAAGISTKQSSAWLTPLPEDLTGLPADAGQPLELDIVTIAKVQPEGGAVFAALPVFARKATTYTEAKAAAVDRIYTTASLEVLSCAKLDEIAKPGESEGDFRARLQLRARELRDAEMDKLRQKYAAKFRGLDDDRARAGAAIEREKSQARSAKMDTGVSILGGLLGALMGRKNVAGSITRGASAAKSATRAWQQSGDVARAEERLAAVGEEEKFLNGELERELAKLRDAWDIDSAPLEKQIIRPLKKNIIITAAGLAWMPHYDVGGGSLETAFEG